MGILGNNRIPDVRQWIAALGLVFLGNACAYSSDGLVATQCEVGEDQTNSFTGSWPITPVPIALSQQYSSSGSSATAFLAGVGTWNNFFTASKTFNIMDGGSGSPNQSALSRPSSICGQIMISGERYVNPVVVYNYGSGSWPYDPNIIALTSVCPFPEEPLSKLYMGVMEINSDNFFVEGKRNPDLESIFVHEMGHLIGLNHSCEVGGTGGTADCNGQNPAYIEAALFPIVLFPDGQNGELRRSLRRNDQTRANCLFDNEFGTTPDDGSTI